MTRLGRFTETGEGRYYPETGEVLSSSRFVASNGDTLFLEFYIEDIELGLNAGRTTIRGGTGRFSGAQGDLAYNVQSEDEEFVFPFFTITRTGGQFGTISH